jgi:hypothetical protein
MVTQGPRYQCPSPYDEVVYDPDTDLSFGVFCRRNLPANDSADESGRDSEWLPPKPMWFVGETTSYGVPDSCAGVGDYS